MYKIFKKDNSIRMASTPQKPRINDCNSENVAHKPQDGDQIVISGMSGVYPQAKNVDELSKILYEKVNPVTADNMRWIYNHPEVSNYTGKIPELNRFDAQFFKVHYKLAPNMDIMGRKVLEQAYQAIYDAGLNPEYFSGQKVGVYVGSCFSECEKFGLYASVSRFGFGIPGCSKTMLANRISYWLNTTGPSMAIDQSCCSSLVALEVAYHAIKTGQCEAAIVAGANLCLHPHSSVHYRRIIPMSKDGKTRSFDQNAAGCAKSEAINVLILQKAKDALRIYADLVHVKSQFSCILENESGPRYGFYRDPSKLAEFLKSFYEEAGVSPEAVEYVEAFGSAVPEADKNELDAISQVFCSNRNKPLPVGSVMSNIGFCEAASGITAITKVLLGYQRGEIAGNLYCEQPREDVAALHDGRMFIATDHLPFRRTYVAVNGLSVSGTNAHVLLKGHYKPKDITKYKAAMPYLVFASGRHEAAVEKVLNALKSRPADPEEIALLHNIHNTTIFGHVGRGYITIDNSSGTKTEVLNEKVGYFDDSRRKLLFVYSGMGSQWPGMGEQLMRIPIFADAVERCHQVLKPKGLDIVNIITSKAEKTLDNILHAFVGITAIQIGLTDVLRALQITPDNIIGHSVGEIGCAYADGCMTVEETILASYSRGLVSLQTTFIKGSMAAVGIGFRKIINTCPPEIDIACHNSSDSCTVSGPAEAMREFVEQLTAKGIFAKEVQCSNIAYHSRYIAEAGPALFKYLQEVIKSPNLRSKRWLSTSVPQEQWNEPTAKYCSAEYHTNNLLCPVLFEETSRLIPPNSVVVEIAPHGLLQAILKRSLPQSCVHIPLTKRGHSDSTVFLLDAIGKLYMEGLNPTISALYAKIEFPVSSGTPILSKLVEWNHTENWRVLLYPVPQRKKTGVCKFIISLQDQEYSYLRGHCVRNKITYPYAAALVAVWDTLAMLKDKPKKKLSVTFQDLHFYSQPVLQDQRQLKLNITILWGKGLFEVTAGDSKVITGIINEGGFLFLETAAHDLEKKLNNRDVYELLHGNEFSYSGEFKSIHSADITLSEAFLLWNNNWVTLIDGMLQLSLLQRFHNATPEISRIRTIAIDVNRHDKFAIHVGDGRVLPASVITELDCIRCGGILMRNIQHNSLYVNCDEEIKFNFKDKWDNCYFEPSREHIGPDSGLTLQIARIGDLNSFHWINMPYSKGKGVNVKVHFAGINNMDVKIASGIVPLRHDDDSLNVTYGMDFSGVTESGERVMGLTRIGAATTNICADPELLWPVPEHWTLEEAATVPLAYLQAFYCLTDRFIHMLELSPNVERNLLVHSGAGALGQAVISVALALGFTVFTTVSNGSKKEFLKKLFPELRDEYIGYSRNQNFCNMILNETNGKGCCVVICGQNELKTMSLTCVAASGVLLDVSQLKSLQQFDLPMGFLSKQRSYYTVDISVLFDEINSHLRKELYSSLIKGITLGYVRPLSRIVYDSNDVPRAFRLVNTSRHSGRVLLNLQDGLTQTYPRIKISEECCQVLVLDGDIFGLQIADYLVGRGARNLYINSSTNTVQLQHKARLWTNHGVRVILSSENIDNTMLEQLPNELDVECIFVVITDANKEKHYYDSVLHNLDTASRIKCPKLKYFITVSTIDNIGETTILNRTENHFPATLLKLPKLRKLGDSSERGMTVRSALKAVERAALSNQPIISATSFRVPKLSLLQELSLVIDVNIPSDCDENMILKDLGVAEENYAAVATFLRINYNLSFSDEQIAILSIKRFKEIEESMLKVRYEKMNGLQMFYSNVISDELLASSDFVPVPSLTSNIVMRNGEFDENQACLCIVPGLEGIYERFYSLCEPLKISSFVLQPGFDKINESIPELAERYVQILFKKTMFKDQFYLLGYENGVAVVLEMAAILEKHGYTGTVFCVGYTPEEFQQVLNEELSEFQTKEQLWDAIVKHMLTLMTDKDCSSIEDVLQGSTDWRLKIAASIRELLGNVSHSAQYARALIETTFGRIVQAREYKPQPLQLRSQLVMIRPSDRNFTAEDRSKFQKNSIHPVKVYQLDTPMPHIVDDPRCAANINENLSPLLLEEFHGQNRCETYFMNRETFVSSVDI